jgi:hypothetical protein
MTSLSDVADISRYHAMASTEVLVLADIENSTQAISQGKYQEVNMFITQCIAALRKGCLVQQLKIQHGGDGFVLVAHLSEFDKISGIMSEMRNQLKMEMGLNIRCSGWKAIDLDKAGFSMYYSSCSHNGGNLQWQFHSEHMEQLEKLMKAGALSMFQSLINEKPNISGFRCDFVPIESKNTSFACCVVNFLQTDLADRFIVMRKVLSLVGTHAVNGLQPPISLNDLNWLTDKSTLDKLAKKSSYYWMRSLTNFWFNWMNRTGFHWNKHWSNTFFKDLTLLPLSVDFMKYDGQLKFVVSVPESKKTSFVESLRGNDAIEFGLHWSDQAVITCSVDGERGNLHFIDGSDGGLTIAANQLKELRRKAALRNTI